jgi:hypothetical protein
MRIPLQSLSADALRGVVEAFVLREGTDYGHREFALELKCEAVERQLAQGDAEVWFDPETGTTDIRPVPPPLRGVTPRAGSSGRGGSNGTGDDFDGCR